MKIVREQREENNSLLKVTVAKDYGQAVERVARIQAQGQYSRFSARHGAHGPRQEDVRQGRAVEQAYRTASNSVFEYLQKENIDYLGDVIPSESRAI